jgi:hypothetical protein
MMMMPTPQQQLVQLAPATLQQMQQSQQFYQQLQAAANQKDASKIIPAAQQKMRDYSTDTYFYDAWRQRANNPTLTRSLLNVGPGTYSVDELQLLPLQQLLLASTDPSGASNQTSMQFRFQDVPRVRLSPDQDGYLAGIAMAYNLLSGLLKMSTPLEDACRPFDLDEDTIAVTETQMETLLYNITSTQQSNVKQMLFVFPLHDRYMSLALRIFIYGDVATDPRTGFKQALNALSPFSWRHALPTGDNAFRLRGENLSEQSEEWQLRKKYHAFLVRLYSMMWRSLVRLRVEQTNLYTPDYGRFIETTLAQIRPSAQSVAVLEARIRAIVARLQLLHGLMFNTAQFYSAVEPLKNIIHPIILQLVGKYLYLRKTS